MQIKLSDDRWLLPCSRFSSQKWTVDKSRNLGTSFIQSSFWASQRKVRIVPSSSIGNCPAWIHHHHFSNHDQIANKSHLHYLTWRQSLCSHIVLLISELQQLMRMLCPVLRFCPCDPQSWLFASCLCGQVFLALLDMSLWIVIGRWSMVD